METLITYREKVQNEIDDTSSRAQAIIDQKLKEIYQEILRQTARYISGTDSEQISTTSGTSSYTPTNTYLEIIAVHNLDNGDWDLLTQIDRNEFLSLRINDDSSTPQYWYLNGSNVVLSPSPDASGTIRVEGVKEPTALESGVDSVIPERFTNVVTLGACAKVLAYEKDPLFKDYTSLYGSALRDMVLELSTQTKQLRPILWKKTKKDILR